jgi:putative spermidine/putrescine transport system ATP-binding protein/spermidine/putrescine transport system ATP-binding protein
VCWSACDGRLDDAAVRLLGASKRFGKVVALEDASLSIRRGELMTLLGPSGCGKTTLLNLVAGFLVVDDGEIEIDGERVNEIPTYKREIGMMFQNYALFPHMSIADNVGYGLRMRGIAKPDLKRRVAEALSLVRLTGVEDRRPHHRAANNGAWRWHARYHLPKVLLLDEPFSARQKLAHRCRLKSRRSSASWRDHDLRNPRSEALAYRIGSPSCSRSHSPGQYAGRDLPPPADRFVASFVGDVNVLRGR